MFRHFVSNKRSASCSLFFLALLFLCKMSSPAKRISKTNKAGLTMSVARIERNLREGGFAKRVSPRAAVYTAAVLEYVCSEILDLAGSEAAEEKCKRIHPRHVMLAIENDSELKKLLSEAIIPSAGVKSHIHAFLLPKNSKKVQPAPPM